MGLGKRWEVRGVWKRREGKRWEDGCRGHNFKETPSLMLCYI